MSNSESNEDRTTHLTVNVNQSHVRNAVRDLINQLLYPATYLQLWNSHVDKEKDRVTRRANEVVEQIVIPQSLINSRVNNLLERDLRQMVKDIVAHEVQKIVRDEVSVAIRHIVQTGLTVEIGTGWKTAVQIKTEEKTDDLGTPSSRRRQKR